MHVPRAYSTTIVQPKNSWIGSTQWRDFGWNKQVKHFAMIFSHSPLQRNCGQEKFGERLFQFLFAQGTFLWPINSRSRSRR